MHCGMGGGLCLGIGTLEMAGWWGVVSWERRAYRLCSDQSILLSEWWLP